MILVILFLLLSLSFLPIFAQETTGKNESKGFKPAGIPNLNYNSDEGFGYGARLSLFNHGKGGYNPYYYVVDANLFLTTGGKKEFFLFFDSPHLLKDNQRITGEVKYQKEDFSPYYGIGNDTEFDESLTDTTKTNFINEDYYRFERTRISIWANYQRLIGKFRTLGGFGIQHTDIGSQGENTLLKQDDPDGIDGGFTNYIKFGVIYDTRDFEPAPNKGDWTDLILEFSNGIFGSDYDYTRFTFTNRHYFTLLNNVVFAERIVYEKTWGDMPFYEMSFFESSFRIDETGGGAKSIRGLLKNRLTGPTKLFGNLELRWRFFDFKALKQNFYLALNGFYDYGRVWKKNEDFSLEDFHSGQGIGLHIGWNENFIIAVDRAKSEEVDSALYIGIGYLF